MNLLWALAGIILLVWVFGLLFSVGGGLIHLLLILVVVVIAIRLLTGRPVLGRSN
jgi:hypothetical protein